MTNNQQFKIPPLPKLEPKPYVPNTRAQLVANIETVIGKILWPRPRLISQERTGWN